jgi:hypothetical protein
MEGLEHFEPLTDILQVVDEGDKRYKIGFCCCGSDVSVVIPMGALLFWLMASVFLCEVDACKKILF